jgi:signal transduction histidine kinase/CheY-like chemotaxis protein
MYVLVPTVLLVFHETTDIQYFLPLDIPDKTELWLRTLLVPTFVAFFIAIEYYISYTFLRRERELEKAFDQVANADRTKSEFLSLMSHELRTPLNAISHILTEITDQQKAMTLEELTTLKSSARQLEYLTNNFVDFKALTQDEAPLEEHTSVDLKQFLEDACNNLKPLADEKDNEIVVEILGVLPACIQLHKATLELALRHILENAIRFSDHSTIQIVCEMVHMQDRPNAFKIRIIDQGIGIDPTQLNRIFEPFYQVETVTQRSNGGTGLGLAISKQCMRMIGGRIEVKSDLGKGSTFELCFTAKACDTPSNLLIETTELPLKNHNVLVVDDNLVNQKISRKFLEKLGANVQVMDDGQQAVNLSNVETFSLIFMDLHMPKMNGFDAAGLIRCSGKNTQTPIIAYSADNQESVQQKAKQAGMTGFVSKPLHFDSLRNVVINQLSEQRNKTAL